MGRESFRPRALARFLTYFADEILVSITLPRWICGGSDRARKIIHFRRLVVGGTKQATYLFALLGHFDLRWLLFRC